MGDHDNYLIFAAIITVLGNLIATVVSILLNQRANRKAIEAGAAAAKNAGLAQIATQNAARDAANAARLLVEAARATDGRLACLQKSADDNMSVTDETHKIVNSQRTAMEAEIKAMQKTINELANKLEREHGGVIIR